MINFHPNQLQLIDFVEGNSAPAMALMISAHKDMCPKCRGRIELLESSIGEGIFEVEAERIDFGTMLSDITKLPAAEQITFDQASRGQPLVESIELDGRQFKLPRTLRRFIAKTGNFSHLLGNLWQAPVDLGPIGKANFIYMQKGGRVPEHTHRGTELTLVINGEFSDGMSDYDTGDFILMGGENTHAPYSEASEGCLVFSIVDAPLHFTSGIARLLNPFSHLFFNTK
ncbi:ChrR family anti-sigma-E factor [Aliiglaciecola sp. LCG003]|uniref:ChrR family anti-sigma-E factor n=1 Tax=Aliiglaciecola sp. LCG003 TaxID=3053655 RepID=UPI0025727AC0|nr:ChrR family anti-sigma-E factor [Aliiglaciecola sp. LCG003]WJG08406.1 ChrR family anti-sigma-E factor [Aliiglaciecola sp. LCG003]